MEKKKKKTSFFVKYIVFPVSFLTVFLVITDPHKVASVFYSKIKKNNIKALQEQSKDNHINNSDEFKEGIFPNYIRYYIVPEDNLSKINTDFNNIELKIKSKLPNDKTDIKIFFSLTCPACLKLVKDSLNENLSKKEKNITYIELVNSLQDLYGSTILYTKDLKLSIEDRLKILYTMSNNYSEWILDKDPKEKLADLISTKHNIKKSILMKILDKEDDIFKSNAINATMMNFRSLTKPKEPFSTPMILIDNKILVLASLDMSKRINEIHEYLMKESN